MSCPRTSRDKSSDSRAKSPSRKLPEDLLKLTLIHIFHALDFLHTEAGVAHTGTHRIPLYLTSQLFKDVKTLVSNLTIEDIQEKNIFLTIENTILSDLEKALQAFPNLHKFNVDGRIIYQSWEVDIP